MEPPRRRKHSSGDTSKSRTRDYDDDVPAVKKRSYDDDYEDEYYEKEVKSKKEKSAKRKKHKRNYDDYVEDTHAQNGHYYDDSGEDVPTQVVSNKKKVKKEKRSKEIERTIEAQPIAPPKVKKEKKPKKEKKAKLAKQHKIRQELGMEDDGTGVKEHSYKIKIKTGSKNEAADLDGMTGPDGKALGKKKSKKQNEHLIKMIRDAVGQGTKIVEDDNNAIVVYINSNQQMNKKEVTSVLKKVIAGKPVKPANSKALKKKEKRKRKEEKLKKKILEYQYKQLKASKPMRIVTPHKEELPEQDNTISSTTNDVIESNIRRAQQAQVAAVEAARKAAQIAGIEAKNQTKFIVTLNDKSSVNAANQSLHPIGYKGPIKKIERTVSVQNPLAMKAIPPPLPEPLPTDPMLNPKPVNPKMDLHSRDIDLVLGKKSKSSSKSRKEQQYSLMDVHQGILPSMGSKQSQILVNPSDTSTSSSDSSDSDSTSDSSDSDTDIQIDRPSTRGPTQVHTVSSTTPDELLGSTHHLPHPTAHAFPIQSNTISSTTGSMGQKTASLQSVVRNPGFPQAVGTYPTILSHEQLPADVTMQHVKNLVRDPTKISSAHIPETVPQAISTEDQEKIQSLMANDALLLKHHSINESYQNAVYDPDADKKSIIVTNVHYGTADIELRRHFEVIGSITRVTIVKDRFTGQPKGLAYIQFADAASVELARALDQTNFNGRPITVIPKFRANLPAQMTTSYPPPVVTRGMPPRQPRPYASRHRTWVRKDLQPVQHPIQPLQHPAPVVLSQVMSHPPNQ